MLFESSIFTDEFSASLPITHRSPIFPTSSDIAASFSMDLMLGSTMPTTTNTNSNRGAQPRISDVLGIGQQSPMPTAADNASSKDSSASFGSAGLSGKSSSKSSHRKRARATSEQVSVLESVFLVNRSPASRLREDLATRLGMAPRQVQVWFQNRRAKEKTQQRNPRALQHHQSMIIDPLAYANTSPDFYSMAMASSFIAGGGSTDPGSATPANGNSGFGASPAAMSFGAGPSGIGYPSAMQSQHQSQQQHSSLIDNHMAFAAAASINAGGNPWMNWSADMAQQDPNSSSSPSQYFPFANPPSLASPGALMSNGQFNGLPMGGAGQFSSDALYMAASAGKMEGYSASNGSGASAITGSAGATTTTASSVAAALMYAANIGDSRRESEMSGMTAVASPTGPESVTMASDATATSVSSAVSPVTTPVAAAAGAATDTCMAAITTTAASHAPATISSDTLRCVSSGASSSQLMLNMGMSVPGVSAGIATAGSDSSGNFNNVMEASAAAAAVAGESSGHATPVSGSRMAGSLRRPAPLALVAHHGSMHPGQAPQFGSSSGMSMAMGGRPGMGYSSLIPEIASFMVLDATRLTVGSWHRVPMSDTELTCLACVEPPPLKPVQRPGNHRPAELDSLVGEFQWIISSCNVRYKMVLPYSAISRIKFRESPDPAVQLVDTVSETVINPQAAMSLLNCALKNPQAKGELSIHVYDLPSYYFQSEGGEWVKIGDFSENLSASNTYVHTVSGSFVTLFCQLRILLATCSRLKIAADPLMSLWLGNMDDPYSAITGIPHNTWLPCSEAVRLHSVNRGNTSDQIVSAETAVSGGDMGDDHSGITSPSHQSSASGSAAMVAGALPAFNMYIPVSAATSSTIGTLTPTPTSMTGTNINHLPMNVMPPALAATRHSVFAFHDSGHPAALAAAAAASAFNNNLAAAMAGGVGQLPLKTQRSASLPFIRSAASINGSGAGKVNPSSSLCRTIDGDSLGPNEASDQEDDDEKSNYQSHQQHSGGSSTPTTSAGMGATTNTSPPQLPQPAAPLPLRQRTSCNHLRRAAPYPVAPYQGTPVAGSSRVNSPQMSPSPYWYAQNLRRASRDSLSSGGNHHAFMLNGAAPVQGSRLPERRESDAELALAMNNVFASGDVFGGHRGLNELYGMPMVPPSPLSNVTMASVMNSGGPNGMHVGPSVSGMANTAGENNGGMSNADIVMAIFNAMNGGNGNGNMTAAAMHNSVSAAATAPITTPISMDPSAGFDPSTFLLTQGIGNSIINAGANIGVGVNNNNNNNNSGAGFGSGAQPMDWCFDWSLPTGLTNSMPHGDNVNVNDNDGDAMMSMDWSKSGAGGPSDAAARPGSTTRG